MICPQTKAECTAFDICQLIPCKPTPPPPPPTLAEIERLMDALVDAAIYSDVPDAQEARATLMAAIQKYGRE